MGIEIERKFLIKLSGIKNLGNGKTIVQGYIETGEDAIVRVRIQDDSAFLTLKGKHIGAKCLEFEYLIPIKEAKEMISNLCKKNIIEKTRYEIYTNGHKWEIDIFHGENDGLVVAEVELDSEDENVDMPSWITREVTGDKKYYNSQLLDNPYLKWEQGGSK